MIFNKVCTTTYFDLGLFINHKELPKVTNTIYKENSEWKYNKFGFINHKELPKVTNTKKTVNENITNLDS